MTRTLYQLFTDCFHRKFSFKTNFVSFSARVPARLAKDRRYPQHSFCMISRFHTLCCAYVQLKEKGRGETRWKDKRVACVTYLRWLACAAVSDLKNAHVPLALGFNLKQPANFPLTSPKNC